MHNTKIECKAVIQLWFSADDINHKSLLVYEQQQQQQRETVLLPEYSIRCRGIAHNPKIIHICNFQFNSKLINGDYLKCEKFIKIAD